VDRYGGRNRRLAIDRCDPWIAQHLLKRGVELFDAQEPLEQARKIKSAEEIACLRLAMKVCDAGVARLRERLRPGLTENQIWATLHETNIAHGGDFIECRLLASGTRTLPWFQEASHRVVNAGEIVTFDTDMIAHGQLGPTLTSRSSTELGRRAFRTLHIHTLHSTLKGPPRQCLRAHHTPSCEYEVQPAIHLRRLHRVTTPDWLATTPRWQSARLPE
jgi:Metallopeptidase family M24